MMKQFLFIGIAMLGISIACNAQWQYGSNNSIYYNSGKVSIKTTSPSPAADVNLTVKGAMINYGLGACVFFAGQNNTNVGYGQYGIEYNDGEGGLNFWKPTGSNGFKNWVLFLKDNGNVGIGTSNPTHKLTVKGSIHAREILVTATAGADFVFEENYELKSLGELERFIVENKHLPDIAPAEEMIENGINISELQIKLLQKVEELTLYVIELKKELDMVKQQDTQTK